MGKLFTVGHSNHDPGWFVGLLEQHEIEVLVDVRTRPVSGYCPYFSAKPLESLVKRAGIKYLFLGKELGGQPPDPSYYDERGHAMYWRMAEAGFFLDGLRRLRAGIEKFRVAIMCSEENPSQCHRRLLVARVLYDGGIEVLHIRGDGRVEAESEIRRQEAAARPQLDLFHESDPEQERLKWKSIQSGLRERALGSSSVSFEEAM